MARRVLGLDIGSHAVKAVELRQTLRALEIVQLQSFALDAPAPALATELRHLFSAHDLPSQNVVVAVAGDRHSTRRLVFPFRDRRKIAAAVPFELAGQVPFDLDEFVTDWDVVGEARAQAEVATSLAPRTEVSLLLETLREAGISPRVIEAEGLVLSNLAALVELPGTCVLADVGHRKTSLCLCRDGRVVATRTVPVAGHALTLAIAQQNGLGEVEAEREKIEHGVIGNPRATGAAAVLDRLARELVRTLGAFEPLHAGGPGVDRIHLLGGSARLAGLDGYLAERSGLGVDRLPLPRGPLGAAFLARGDTLLFSPAMALALRGTTRTVTRMNLRQGELAERIDLRGVARELRPTGLFAGALALAALLWLGVDLGVNSRRASTTEGATRAVVREALGGREPAADPLSAMESELKRVQKRADTLGVYRGNLSALDVLTEISKLVPADLDVVFEELSIDRDVVQIQGHSSRFGAVDQLKQVLGRYPPFSDVGVGDITTDPQRGGQTFSVRIRISAEGAPS